MPIILGEATLPAGRAPRSVCLSAPRTVYQSSRPAAAGVVEPMKEKRTIGERLAGRHRTVVRNAHYSRFVGAMKLLLPATAAVLVVLVVAWPSLTRRDDGLRLSFADIEAGTTEEAVYLTNARYFGSDDEDQPFSLMADEVFQLLPDSDEVHFTLPKADVTLANGDRMVLEADRGTLSRSSGTLVLDGGVIIDSEDGYQFFTSRAEIDLNASVASSDQPIEGSGPMGRIKADSFRLDQLNRTYLFEGRVKLVLLPKTPS